MGTLSAKETLLSRSGRLFAVPSFITGMAKVLDIGATFHVYSEDATSQEADYWSMLSDWYAIGDDLRFALAEQESDLAQ